MIAISGMELDAVIFDWGGTLTPWHTIDPYDCWYSVTHDEEQAQALIAAENEVWGLVRHEHRSGTLTDILARAELTLTEAQLQAYYQWWDAHSYHRSRSARALRGIARPWPEDRGAVQHDLAARTSTPGSSPATRSIT